ncbi:hypothetical protein NMG29_06725 [Streptomyces cocklensis]|uniref:Uncharacterized protein n=1 Tax=Actinacidiphila cocklensis TaxID=887465 RepID=A0A9W4DND8_9ACTN|nr:hypothetical protein [Actinacidiphila cocklensis]MDD1057926.1 hypothetical protein [Actinacidiphila cocklensis]CAG6392793.1 conserved hypothetical protein [Actinacidiphila cocklensis]
MAEIPTEVAAAQRASDEAWAALQAHREQVNERRQADPRVEHPKFGPILRPWTTDEDAEYDRLHAAVLAAAEARAAAMVTAGIVSTYSVEGEMRAAARAAAGE